MTVPILSVRPEPGSRATVAAGREVGLTIEACPLFEVRPLAWDPPPPDSVDGLLLGSSNALRHAGPALDLFRGMPVHAVGEATARAAEAAGFTVATVGPGSLQPLVDQLAPPVRLLRIAVAALACTCCLTDFAFWRRVVRRNCPIWACASNSLPAICRPGL